jgi:hypothetical protein
MYYRIELGTDVAKVGIWDAEAGNGELRPYADLKNSTQEAAWEEDTAAGRLFLIETGSDGSYNAEFYINEPVPADKLRLTRTVNREFLLRCPSGTLVAGGLEDYRMPNPRITGPDDGIPLPPGPYHLRLHVGDHDDRMNEADVVTAVGEADYAYYQKVHSRQSLGCLLVFTAFIPAIVAGWDFLACALFAIAAGAVGYMGAGFLMSLNDRYQRIADKVNAYHQQIPALVFELTPVDEVIASKLEGGRVAL